MFKKVYANGIRNIDLHFIIQKLAAPVISVLLLSLTVPYVIAVGITPLIGEFWSFEKQWLVFKPAFFRLVFYWNCNNMDVRKR